MHKRPSLAHPPRGRLLLLSWDSSKFLEEDLFPTPRQTALRDFYCSQSLHQDTYREQILRESDRCHLHNPPQVSSVVKSEHAARRMIHCSRAWLHLDAPLAPLRQQPGTHQHQLRSAPAAAAPAAARQQQRPDYQFQPPLKRKRLAVFVSGGGSNLKAIQAAFQAGAIRGELAVNLNFTDDHLPIFPFHQKQHDKKVNYSQ